MHLPTAALTLALAHLSTAVTMTKYVAGSGVEPEFATFVEEFYAINEDPLTNATFLDLLDPNIVFLVQPGALEFDGASAMLAVRNNQLPATGTPKKAWWHVIQGAEVVDEEEGVSKTYEVTMLVESNYVPGNCSQSQ